MKWYTFLIIFWTGVLIAFGVVWLWSRKKAGDAKTGIPPAPADNPGVRSAIERGKQRISDLFHKGRI